MAINKEKLFDANSFEIKENVSGIDEILEYEQILLSISKSIIKYRKENNLTQKQLAEKLNENQVMISKLERGNYNPTIKLLHGLSRKLTDSSELFIGIIKDMISSLYKSKNIGYKTVYTEYEVYNYNIHNRENNITYLYVNNKEKNYGGQIHGKINSTTKFSANG